MLYSRIITAAACLLAVIGTGACTETPAEKLMSDTAAYGRGESIEVRTLEKDLLEVCKSAEMPASTAVFRTCAVDFKGITAEIVHPFKLKIELQDEKMNAFAAVSDTLAVFSDGYSVSVYNREGVSLADKKLAEKKSPIKAITVSGETIYYYSDMRVHSFDYKADKAMPVTEQRFSPPYSKYYHAELYPDGNNLGVLAGAAGDYYFSVIDLADGSPVLSNVGCASSKLDFTGGRLLYISSTRSGWLLQEYTLSPKKKNLLQRIGDIKDIELFSDCFYMEGVMGFFLHRLNERVLLIPFSFTLAGSSAGSVLIEYEDKIYPCPPRKLMNFMVTMRDSAPELFNGE